MTTDILAKGLRPDPDPEPEGEKEEGHPLFPGYAEQIKALSPSGKGTNLAGGFLGIGLGMALNELGDG